MTDRDDVKSLANAIMMDATKASQTIQYLNAKLSFLPYKFCDDGPAPDKARLFSCMPFVHDGIIHKVMPVHLYAEQMTKDDINEFMSLFKIKGHAYGAMQAIQLFLQKYNHMKGRNGWDSLADDVEYIGSVDDLPLCDFQYKLDAHAQCHTTMGLMITNGLHRTGKVILVGGRKRQRHILWKIQMSCDKMYLTSSRCLWKVYYISRLLLIFIIQSHALGPRMSSQISRLTVLHRINREDCRYYALGRTQYNLPLMP
jgi:hypothetical protein